MRPVAFGYKCCWYVVRSTDTVAVADTLGLKDRSLANWEKGDVAAHNYDGDQVFITPPVGEWTAIVGVILRGNGTPELKHALIELSETFGLAMFFGTHRVSEYCEWARAEEGTMTRAFYAVGWDTIKDEGVITIDEIELGFGVPDLELDWEYEEPMWFPDQEFVLDVAGRWCFNPITVTLEKYPELGVAEPGILGTSPGRLPH